MDEKFTNHNLYDPSLEDLIFSEIDDIHEHMKYVMSVFLQHDDIIDALPYSYNPQTIELSFCP